MSLLPVEKASFRFVSKFYFYLWPFAIGWDENYTFTFKKNLAPISKLFYYIYLLFMFAYSASGLFVAFYFNKIFARPHIPVIDAVILTSIVAALILIWLTTQISVQVVVGFNGLLSLVTRLKTGIFWKI